MLYLPKDYYLKNFKKINYKYPAVNPYYLKSYYFI